MTISVEWLDDWDSIIEASGRDLDRAHQPSLFDRIDWYRAIGTHVFPDRRPHAVHTKDASGSIWLFLFDDGARSAASLECWYSLDWSPVFTGDGDKDALLRATLRALAKRYDRITLRPLGENSADRMMAALGATGWRGYLSRTSTNWTINTAAKNFEGYWQGRPSQLRNTVARRARQHPLEIKIYRDFNADAWNIYEDIYGESWKPTEGSFAFLKALAEREGAAGTLRLGIARTADGRAVAAQFWLVENGVATIHKLAHREEARHASPGSILSRAMFAAAIDEDKVSRISFGLGDEPYKAEWMDTPRPVFTIEAYRPLSLRGAAGIARQTLARLARRLRGR